MDRSRRIDLKVAPNTGDKLRSSEVGRLRQLHPLVRRRRAHYCGRFRSTVPDRDGAAKSCTGLPDVVRPVTAELLHQLRPSVTSARSAYSRTCYRRAGPCCERRRPARHSSSAGLARPLLAAGSKAHLRALLGARPAIRTIRTRAACSCVSSHTGRQSSPRPPRVLAVAKSSTEHCAYAMHRCTSVLPALITRPSNTGDKLRSGARVHAVSRRGHEAACPFWQPCRRKLRQLHPLVRLGSMRRRVMHRDHVRSGPLPSPPALPGRDTTPGQPNTGKLRRGAARIQTPRARFRSPETATNGAAACKADHAPSTDLVGRNLIADRLFSTRLEPS